MIIKKWIQTGSTGHWEVSKNGQVILTCEDSELVDELNNLED